MAAEFCPAQNSVCEFRLALFGRRTKFKLKAARLVFLNLRFAEFVKFKPSSGKLKISVKFTRSPLLSSSFVKFAFFIAASNLTQHTEFEFKFIPLFVCAVKFKNLAAPKPVFSAPNFASAAASPPFFAPAELPNLSSDVLFASAKFASLFLGAAVFLSLVASPSCALETIYPSPKSPGVKFRARTSA